jgi:hypothetical protein
MLTYAQCEMLPITGFALKGNRFEGLHRARPAR